MDILGIFELGAKLIDKIIPDPAQRDAAKLALIKAQQDGELAQLTADAELAKAQMAINQTEAANPSAFVSGWRPFIGWVCGVGLAYAFLLKPALSPLLFKTLGVAMEPLDLGTLLTLLFGMLGLGGMRTVEKVTGVARR